MNLQRAQGQELWGALGVTVPWARAPLSVPVRDRLHKEETSLYPKGLWHAYSISTKPVLHEAQH